MINNNILGMLQQLQSNPMAMLSQKFKIPQDLDVNDPNAIIQHLMNTGQVSQQAYNNARNMAMSFKK
jgi:hypothetical protein